ncbi:MAG: mechanosensitive ion channel domain-containing protein [bacterium]
MKAWLPVLAIVLVAAPVHALDLAPATAPDTMGRGTTATYVWTVAAGAGEPGQLLLASVHLDASTNWHATLSAPQQSIRAGESRTFEVVLQTASRPSPHVAHVRFEVEAVAGTNATHLESSVTVTASGTDLVLDRFENPLPPPLDNSIGVFLLDVIAWLAIALGARLLVKPALRVITSRTRNKFDDALADIAGTPLFALLFVLGLKQSLEAFELPDWAFATTETAARIVQITVVGYVLYRIWYEALHEYGRRHAERLHSRLDERLLPVLEKMGGVLIVLGAVFFFVAGLGIDLTYFAAGSVLVSMVVAFAAQDTLSNFFSGLHLLLDQPFREGDEIALESGEVCQVARIGLRSTHLYHRSNHEMIVMPNNQLASKRVVNLVKPDRRYKITIDVGVAFGCDPETVKRALVETAKAHPQVLADGGLEPYARLRKLGDHGLDFALRAWIGDVRKRNDVESDLREAVVKRFTADGLEFSTPTYLLRTP